MSRFWTLLAMGGAFCTGTIAAPQAHADVLEISENGSVWIARGSTARQLAAAAAAAQPVVAKAPGETMVTPVAGPSQWQAHMARIATRYDLSPSLLEALIWQESRWRPQAVSPAGARGLTQLMPGTARDMGVNPDDPIANLEGGARYLRLMLNTFGGDVEKALAAYNAGPARVAKANGIPRIRETQDYVASIMGRLSQPVRR